MKKSFFCVRFLWLLAVVAFLAGCTFSDTKAEGGQDRSIVLMTWNVHNLFDGKDNGFEYDEFLESSGWSAEKYLGRINAISAAIVSIEFTPDIILFQEIESHKILEDLIRSMPYGYSWSHFANNPGAALGIGILSRLPLLDNKVHSITIGNETTPRPVLESRVYTENGEFVIFSCHWKSKLGGDDVTENVRKASARVIIRRIRELWKTEPELGIIVAGDLNENHDEFYKREARIICALLPDDPYAAQLTGLLNVDAGNAANLQKDFLFLCKNRPSETAHLPEGSIVLYSPWMNELENGSYYYRGSWETIDHFLVSGQFFNTTGLKYNRAMVAGSQPFTNKDGYPDSYNPRTGSGLSDHLPLLVVLKFAGY